MRFNEEIIGNHKMNWNTHINEFIQKAKVSKSFYYFLYNILDFGNKSDSDRWRSFSQNLTRWNNKYLDYYEKIVLYSPVMWNLNITVNVFHILEYSRLENEHWTENWLYWIFLSSYMNYYVLNNMVVREKENRIYPWEYFLKASENMSTNIETFLCNFDLEYLFKKNTYGLIRKH